MKQQLEHYETEARLALGSQHGGFIRWHDAEVGESVASVLSAETNDPLGESNLAVALERLAEHVEASDVWEGSVGRSGRSWLRVLTVRVLDRHGVVTRAWVDTVDLVLDQLKDYPLLDENDYADRRWTVLTEELNDLYGPSAELVAFAFSELSNYDLEELIGDHDTALELVEQVLDEGLYPIDGPEELEGLRYYVAQRKNVLHLPVLVEVLKLEVEA